VFIHEPTREEMDLLGSCITPTETRTYGHDTGGNGCAHDTNPLTTGELRSYQMDRMEIQGTLNGNIVEKMLRKNLKRDGTESIVLVEVMLDREQASKHFGDDFDQLCFGAMQVETDDDDKETVLWLSESIKPAEHMRPGKHVIKWPDGTSVVLKPKLMPINTVPKQPCVIACLRFAIDTSEAKLLANIEQWVAETGISLEFNPQQAELFDGNTAGETEPDGEEHEPTEEELQAAAEMEAATPAQAPLALVADEPEPTTPATESAGF